MDHQQINRKQATNSSEVALANEVFDQFCNASTLKSILGYYRHLCELLKIRPNVINQFYPKLKTKLRSWKAQALWKKFDQRASHKCYTRGKACPNTRVSSFFIISYLLKGTVVLCVKYTRKRKRSADGSVQNGHVRIGTNQVASYG